MAIKISELNYDDQEQVAQLVHVLNTYSQEDGGGNQEVSAQASEILPERLRELSNSHVLVALEQSGDASQVVGVAICFGSFSTFKAMPVLNLHDLAVLPESRGNGIGNALLDAVENHARKMGCCKVTLEVIASNTDAVRLYQRKGFNAPTRGADTLFLAKPLS